MRHGGTEPAARRRARPAASGPLPSHALVPDMTTETASYVPTGPASDPGILNRVAEVTLAFWVMKVLATTLGETAGDFCR